MLVEGHRNRIDVIGAIRNSSALNLFAVIRPSALSLSQRNSESVTLPNGAHDDSVDVMISAYSCAEIWFSARPSG
jgi:hypothetical protein